jgi:ankyrin repeat protein
MLDKTNSQMLFEKISSFIEQYPEYSHVTGIPVSEEMIQGMEEKLNVRFPYEYRLFLEHWGELYFYCSCYTYYGLSKWKDKIIQHVVDWTLDCREHGLPNSYIVFSSDEGDEYLCMDVSKENPDIQRWDFYEQYFVATLADSFFEQICNDINNNVIRRILEDYNISISKIQIKCPEKLPALETKKQPPNNDYSLHHAADKGNLEEVRALVENGTDVNLKNRSNKTPLFFAARNGNLELVKYLIENHANVNVIDKDGEKPIFYAVQSGNLEVVKYLVENRAHVKAKNNKDITPLFYAAKDGYLEIIKYLVEKGADVTVKDNIYGEIPHFNAACSGHLEVVKYLVEKGLDVNVKSKYYKTPIFNAVQSGHLEIVQYLVEQGAEVNVKNNEGKTPLDVADKEEIKIFLQNAGGKSGKDIK